MSEVKRRPRYTPPMPRALGWTPLAVLLAAGDVTRPAQAAPMPHSAPPPRTRDRPGVQAGCVTCHPAIAREWSDSLHHASASDEPYHAAYAREPLPFCQACHVPEAQPRQTPDAWAAAIGVGCVTCHLTATDQILATPGTTPAPHRLRRDPAFADSRACAGCHEFGFPDAALLRRPDLMQATVQEHKNSWAAAYPCADCHMPWVDDGEGRGHRSHRFAASRDPALLARAVGVSARRLAGDIVELTLTPNAAGHAFPTGDLFRRLELRVQLLDHDDPRPPLRRTLGRSFGQRPHNGIMTRAEIADTRVHHEPITVRFDLHDARPAADLCEDLAPAWVSWELRYQRVAFPDPRREFGAQLDGEVIVAHGVLPGALE